MKVTIAIEFPCTPEEWARVEHIKAITGFIASPDSIPSDTPERGDNFEDQDEQEGQLLMDYCLKNRVGKCKPTQSGLIRLYVKENPGCTIPDMCNSIHETSAFEVHKLKKTVYNLIYGNRSISKIEGRLYLSSNLKERVDHIAAVLR